MQTHKSVSCVQCRMLVVTGPSSVLNRLHRAPINHWQNGLMRALTLNHPPGAPLQPQHTFSSWWYFICETRRHWTRLGVEKGTAQVCQEARSRAIYLKSSACIWLRIACQAVCRWTLMDGYWCRRSHTVQHLSTGSPQQSTQIIYYTAPV